MIPWDGVEQYLIFPCGRAVLAAADGTLRVVGLGLTCATSAITDYGLPDGDQDQGGNSIQSFLQFCNITVWPLTNS